MAKLFPALIAMALLASTQAPTRACIHPPSGFAAPIDAGAQRGLVFWDNGREVLVIQPGYLVNETKLAEDDLSEGRVKSFKSFAWLLPLPALPDSYAEAETALFDALHEFTAIEERIPRQPREEAGPRISGAEETGPELEFLPTLEIGSYAIQPVKAKGEAGQAELKGWLKDSGFGEVDERVLRFYIQRGWYWLAIKLSADEGLPAGGSVKPLAVSFKTQRPVYPLKINDKAGEFDLELWLITRDEVDVSRLATFGMQTPEQFDEQFSQRNRVTAYAKLPESVRAQADTIEEFKAMREGDVFCYRLQGRALDAEDGIDLGLLQEDLHFTFTKDASPKPEKEVQPLPEPEKPKDETPPEGK